jgi:hypothetical protein
MRNSEIKIYKTPEEKDTMIKVIVNLINKDNS